MKKWNDLTGSEKWMLLIILLLLVAIATRWKYVCGEISGSWKDRFSKPGIENPEGNSRINQPLK